MGSSLFDLSIRLLNAVIGGFIAFVGSFGRSGARIARAIDIDHDTTLLIATLGGAAVGFIWGAQLWSLVNRRLENLWTRRGP